MEDNGTMGKVNTEEQQLWQEEEGMKKTGGGMGRIIQNEIYMKIPCANPLPCKLI